MLYLIALLAIAAKAQTDTSCGLGSLDCTSSTYADSGLGVCGTVTVGGVSTETCVPCNTDADCGDYWSTFYENSGISADTLECYDLGEAAGTGATGATGCYPEYCGVSGTCTSGTCVSTYCVTVSGVDGTCTDSDDCDAGSACITSSGVSVCVAGACNLDGDDCDSGETCYAVDTSLGYGACVTGITTGTDCDCNESDCDCDSGESCITYEGVGFCATGVTACTKDSQCSGDTDTCATDYGFCYKSCSSNSGCSTGETCQTDPASGLKGCGEPDCTSDSDCSGSLVCDSDGEGDCVICVDTADCTANSAYGEDYSCQNSVCIADSCADDSSACGAYVCTADGACVICELDGDDCTTGTSCYAVDGVNACYAYDPASVSNNDGINQITTYIAMVIMAMVAVNM
eukprot:CAMPEP_0201565346 /NCGR_PEP_ID=MMETSP0190_2-20130828/4408_1 /ASSEMBLY_ACC=CAM_ASM_000263 /TAXON_ID=37353 /ORGANISM="Rosalina sp." /LENGTH=401 /DNA_ID=CAMNT_0047982721 /DNA_START=99 /DNA_END=1304 /DNA_ORIENTATION=+